MYKSRRTVNTNSMSGFDVKIDRTLVFDPSGSTNRSSLKVGVIPELPVANDATHSKPKRAGSDTLSSVVRLVLVSAACVCTLGLALMLAWWYNPVRQECHYHVLLVFGLSCYVPLVAATSAPAGMVLAFLVLHVATLDALPVIWHDVHALFGLLLLERCFARSRAIRDSPTFALSVGIGFAVIASNAVLMTHYGTCWVTLTYVLFMSAFCVHLHEGSLLVMYRQAALTRLGFAE